MVKARLRKSDIDRDPSILWNAFIDVVGGREDAQRTAIQQCARYCFYYDGEIQNGGHFQFFENSGLEHACKVLASLGELGLSESREILSAAYEKAKHNDWGQISSVQEFLGAAGEEMFRDEDDAHYSLKPQLLDRLQAFAAEHPAEFFDIVPD